MLKPHRVSSSDLEQARTLSRRVGRSARETEATPEPARATYVDLRDVTPPATTLDYTTVGEEAASEFEPDLSSNGLASPEHSSAPTPPQAEAPNPVAPNPPAPGLAEDTLPEFEPATARVDDAGRDPELAEELAAFEGLEGLTMPGASVTETPAPSRDRVGRLEDEAPAVDQADSTAAPSDEPGVFTLRDLADDDDLDELFDEILGPDTHEA